MEEHREHTPREDGPPQEDNPPPASEHPEPVERRDFFRRSAEVAAISLFGLGGLDPLIDRVLAKVAERQGGDHLASLVARHLSESGVMTSRGHAALVTPECPSSFGEAVLQGCPPPNPPFQQCPLPYGCEQWHMCGHQPNFDCLPDENYSCTANTLPKFTGCRYPGIHCEWGESFYCQVDEDHFDCDRVVDGQNLGFSCPPWIAQRAWFDCYPPAQGGQYGCTYPNTFDCASVPGHEGAGYLCPDTTQFEAICTVPPDVEWDCAGRFRMVCEGDGETYDCPSLFYCDSSNQRLVFDCGIRVGPPPGQGTFTCSERFYCGSHPGMYDVECAGQHFRCGTTNPDEFVCNTHHEFACTDLNPDAGGGFECGGDRFICSAGGNRCGVGPTGGYDLGGDPQPGDFLCHSAVAQTQGFVCDLAFQCSGMADDFRCYDEGAQMFACTNAFSGCLPSSSGSFRCNQTSGEFACTGFTCPAGFSNS